MRNRGFFQALKISLALHLVAISSGYAQTFDIVTLLSPNERRNGQFAQSVSQAGDVNRDGLPDVIVGAPFDGEGGSGRAYVFSGRDASLILELTSPSDEAPVGFGYSVAGAGDVNQDGFADLIVGNTSNREVRPNDTARPDTFMGRAYIFSGQDGSLLFAFEPPIQALESPNQEGLFGTTVAAAGDVNQDGRPDVIIGTGWESSVTDPRNCGRAYVFSGKDGSLLFELISPNSDEGGRFGDSVGSLGDVNQDGSADVIVGAWGEDPGTSPDSAGRAYLFSGQDGSLLFQLVSPNEDRSGAFGWSVAGAGDVNQDGTPDALVGAYAENPGTSPNNTGRAYVFSGQDGSLLFELNSPNEEANGSFGWSIAGAGDVNGDGYADAIVGADQEDPGTSPSNAGRAYVFSGLDGSLLFELWSPNQEAGGSFGNSVSGAGEANQDGFADVIVGARFEDPDSSPINSGRAHVFMSNSGQSQAFQSQRRRSLCGHRGPTSIPSE